MSDFRQRLFTARSYTPLPFLAVMLLFAHPTGWSMAVGAVVAFSGELLRYWGVAYAGSLTRVTGSVGAPQMIVAGPFAYVRNPLYVGNILLYIGVGIMSQALWPWLAIVALIWFSVQYALIVTLEEEFLAQHFGAAYLEFRANVPRFFPRLSRWHHQAQEHQRPDWSGAKHSERRTWQAIGIVTILLLVLWRRG